MRVFWSPIVIGEYAIIRISGCCWFGIIVSESDRGIRVRRSGSTLSAILYKVDDDVVGILSDVLLLPDSLSGLYATDMRAHCTKKLSL